AFSRRVLVAAFEAIFEVFGADDNPAADRALRGCADPGWEELLEAGVRRLKREAQNCDEEEVEGAAVNGEAFIESGVPPVVEAGALGEAIAALWSAIKGRIRLAQEFGYRGAAPPATALSPLPESAVGSERVEEAESTTRGDDLSEDIVRLKDIREGLGNILDGTREQAQSRAGAAVKPPATNLSSPISKSRLHPRQSSYHPPPATPASSARKR
ncbi:hypothetical protein FOZ63_018392, partial [Perkinsus olseni]